MIAELPTLIAALTAVILFVFGLEHFSSEIERISGERFRKSLSNATRIPIFGVAIGAIVTGIIQSSSATSVITISLVNAGVLSFKNSVGIIFGSNIGTTITAQLVAFKLTAFAPLLIIAGFLLSLVRNRYSMFGKAVFYFGFVFFSLNLISNSLAPLQENAALVTLLTEPQNPLIAILVGCLFTAAVQSSSVTTGLAIVFVQQGVLGLENAVPLIMGANIGTTATALIAVFDMDIAAKKTALSHFLFNVGGVVIFTPMLFLFGHRLTAIDTDPAIALAGIHFVFNVATSLLFTILLTPFVRLVDKVLGEGKMDFERLPLPIQPEGEPFDDTVASRRDRLLGVFTFLEENYNLVTLSIEANYRGIHDAAEKRIEYIEFLKREYMAYFSRVVSNQLEENQSLQLMNLVTRFDYLFQIHDSIVDLFNTKRIIDEQFIELERDILVLVRELSNETLALFEDIGAALDSGEDLDLKSRSRDLQGQLDKTNRALLALLVNPERRDAGALTNFVTYSQRLKDKLVNFHASRMP